MIQNNFLIVFCIILLMGVQVNFFFNSVFDKSAKKQNRFIYFIIFGLLDYLYLVIPASLILSSMLSFLVIFSFAQSYTVEFKTKFTFSILYGVLGSLSNFISLYLFYSLDSVDFSVNSINEQDQIANTKAILLSSMIMFAIIQIIRLLAKRRSFSLDNRYYALFLV
ncbi:ATP-binding protein, partial [Brevibacillus brevis]